MRTERQGQKEWADQQSGHPRFAVLDGLRALSICLVLGAHLLPLGPKQLQFNATVGAMGMSLFFALSGFLIIRSIGENSVLAFMTRRLARIMPLAYLYILIVLALHPMSGASLLASLGFVLNYHPDLMLPETEHLWSLAVEMHFYLLIAVIMLFNRRALPLVWPLCIAITSWRILEGAHLSIATHLRVDEILAGACVATLSASVLDRLKGSQGMWVVALLAWCVASHPESGWLQFLRPYVTGFLLASTLRLPHGAIRRALSARLPKYIATISYALYVIHPLTAHGWWNAGSIEERYLIKRPVSLLITFLAAHFSTFHWERYWMRVSRRWLINDEQAEGTRRLPEPSEKERLQPKAGLLASLGNATASPVRTDAVDPQLPVDRASR